MARRPLVSIIMPVYNPGMFLPTAIGSIIEQTLTDWELICINDGSSDGSRASLDWFARQDSRIRVEHRTNSGIVAALNRGIELATAPLIARMDADDIAMPDRLHRQTEFLSQNPSVLVVGTSAIEIDSDGDPLRHTILPTDSSQLIQRLLHRETAHIHPSVMIRSAPLRAVNGYRAEYQWVEDHDLWLRLSQRGDLANLTEPLLCYRQHGNSICWQKSDRQRQLMNTLLTEAYSVRGLMLPAECIMAESTTRASGGPGKWARIAARGGYPGCAMKHLRKLWRREPWSRYTLRMSAEVLLRSIPAVAKSWFVGPNLIPELAHWEERLQNGLAERDSTPRAA